MNLQEFENLPYEVREKHIMDHRHYMGVDRRKHIIKGEAVLDFFKNYLNYKAINPKEDILRRIDDNIYYHCSNCGGLFNNDFSEKNKIGFLSKSLGFLEEFFNITSGACDSCFETRRHKCKNK